MTILAYNKVNDKKPALLTSIDLSMYRIALCFLLISMFTVVPHQAKAQARKGGCFGQNYIVINGASYQLDKFGNLNNKIASEIDLSHCRNVPYSYQSIDISLMCKNVDLENLVEGAVFDVKLNFDSSPSILKGPTGAVANGVIEAVPELDQCVKEKSSKELLTVPIIVKKRVVQKIRLASAVKASFILKKAKERNDIELQGEVLHHYDIRQKCPCIYVHKENGFYKIIGEGKIVPGKEGECMGCKIPEQSPMEKKGMIPQ